MLSIAVLNQKGGVGKTTLATNLAAAGILDGKRTVLLDLDAQGSIVDWCAARAPDSQLAELIAHRISKPLSAPIFRELTSGADLVVMDAPPRLGELTRSAAVFADVALIPLTPGPYDLWSTHDTVTRLDDADQLRTKLGRRPVRRVFVVNHAVTGTVIARETHRALAGETGEVAEVVIHSRVAFGEAASAGETPLTVDPDGAAADEIRSLYKTLLSAPRRMRSTRDGKITQPHR